MKAAKRGVRGDQRERCREIDPRVREEDKERARWSERERGGGDGEA